MGKSLIFLRGLSSQAVDYQRVITNPPYDDIWTTYDHYLSTTSHIFSGWWYTYPSEKYEFVNWFNWDDEIPKIWKVIIHSCSRPPTSFGPSPSPLYSCHFWLLLWGFTKPIKTPKVQRLLLLAPSFHHEGIVHGHAGHHLHNPGPRCAKWTVYSMYPLVNIPKTMENHHFLSETPLFLRPFSIANC